MGENQNMEQVWFLFLYGWVPAALVVIWEAARCLRTDWRGEWKFLAWMLGLLAADLNLWLVGEPVLAAFGLAWRVVAGIFFSGSRLGAGGGLDAAGGSLRPLPG